MTERRIRRRLDDWRFWVGVAYFGLAAVVMGLYLLFGRQSAEAAKRAAIQRASALSEVSNCANSVKNAPVGRGFIATQRAIITNSILTTTAALQAEDANDPLRHVRLASLARLEAGRMNLNRLNAIFIATTPTKAKCNRLAVKLGIKLPFPRD